MFKKIFVAAAFGAATLAAQASANLVANGSFDGTTGDYVYNGVAPSIATAMPGFGSTSGTVADWSGSFVSIASNSGAWGTPSALSGGAASLGSYVAGIQSDGTLSQSLELSAGTYELSWIDANRLGGSNQSYSVAFGGDVLDALVTTTAGNGWTTESLEFTVGADTTADLTFTGLSSWATSDATSFIDNVSVTAVPEPSSVLMMVVATLGLLAWRRRSQA